MHEIKYTRKEVAIKRRKLYFNNLIQRSASTELRSNLVFNLQAIKSIYHTKN